MDSVRIMRGRSVDSQPAGFGTFPNVGVVHLHHQPPSFGSARVTGWQALSRFLRNVPEEGGDAQGVGRRPGRCAIGTARTCPTAHRPNGTPTGGGGGAGAQGAGGWGRVLSRRMTSPGTGTTRGWGSEPAAGPVRGPEGSARTRPAAISPIRLSGSRTVVSGG